MPHVLVVEDDLMNARLFEVVLRRAGGFEVTVTNDAYQVLAEAASDTVDAILMDVSLSGCTYKGESVNGLQISRLLKETAETCGVPVILATAHSMQGDRERFLRASRADDYISKPVTDHRFLVEKVREQISKRRREGKNGAARRDARPGSRPEAREKPDEVGITWSQGASGPSGGDG